MHHRTRLRVLALMLPLALVASAACDIAIADHREKATEEWRKSYEFAPGGRVEISNVNGKIHVQPGQGNTVEVVATKVARGATADAARDNLRRIQIRESASGGSIRIETQIERSSGIFSNGGAAVEYALRVPPGADVKLTTVNGGVDVSGITGRVVAETTNGGIKARDIGGAIEASSTNGGVEVDLARVAADGARLECTNGGIELRLPADAKATVAARVTNGGIDTGNLSFRATGETSRRRVDGEINGGGPRLVLEGTNGGIRIRAR